MEKRQPDTVIGTNYLLRWYVIPRNPILNIYLHRFLGTDSGKDVHDHPWINVSWILKGIYHEYVPVYGRRDPYVRHTKFIMGPLLKYKQRMEGDIVFRWPRQTHIQVIPAWYSGVTDTLFITGPKFRKWGFWTAEGWVHWVAYLKNKPSRQEH
jgi:hypothetical protein